MTTFITVQALNQNQSDSAPLDLVARQIKKIEPLLSKKGLGCRVTLKGGTRIPCSDRVDHIKHKLHRIKAGLD